MYKILIRPILFLFDPERIHHFVFTLIRVQLAMPLAKFFFRLWYRHPSKRLEREVFGIKFPNPVGLAAGFDKDGRLRENWEYFGFGFVELGTVTPRPQPGNPKKRLFRLSADKALINRMGFNNEGVLNMVNRLRRTGNRNIVLGGNIGKNKDTPNENALDDYLSCYDALYPYVDYFVINVSSPNTPGLRELQEKEPLTRLLAGVIGENAKRKIQKPILLKIAPDLTQGQIDDILEVVQATGVSGLIATNTTIDRSGLKTPTSAVEAIGAGGLSGKPITTKSVEMVRYISGKTGGKLPIIGVGGIMRPKDAVAMLEAGASLVQIYTGFIYGGPRLPRAICRKVLKHQPK